MKFLGIDPGFATTGLAVIDFNGPPTLLDYQVVVTKRENKKLIQNLRVINDDKRRIYEIIAKLREMVKGYKPDAMGLEAYAPRPGMGMGWKSALGFAAILGTCYGCKIPLMIFVPADIKTKIGKNLKSSKEDIQKVIEKKLKIKMKKLVKKNLIEHLSDACALAFLAKDEYMKLKEAMGL